MKDSHSGLCISVCISTSTLKTVQIFFQKYIVVGLIFHYHNIILICFPFPDGYFCNTVETRYNEVLETGKFCLLCQEFCYISSKKQYKTKQLISLDPVKIVTLLNQVFCYVRSLYNTFPL